MVDGAAAGPDLVAGRLPHLAGAEPGVLEAVDQRLDDLALPPCRPAEEGVEDGLGQVEPLDPLGGPVGARSSLVGIPQTFSV